MRFNKLGLLEYRHLDNDYVYGMMLAEPAFEAINALCAGSGMRGVVWAQEYFALPLAFKTILDGGGRFRTVFYMGEVRTAKTLVEYGDGPVKFGSDTRFYNVMDRARALGASMPEVFDVADHRNFLLLKNGHLCDQVAAVSVRVAQELQFIDSRYREKEIAIIPHGNRLIPTSPREKREARERVCRSLAPWLGFAPDLIMTRFARPNVCKAIHRDLLVCEGLDRRLVSEGRRGVLLIVSTWNRHRMPQVIRDLTARLAEYQRDRRGIAIRLVNQFDWPKGTGFNRDDIHRSTDVTFGQSMYESFGLAQLEPLSCGAICLISGVSGARCFIDEICSREGLAAGELGNVLVADYTQLDDPAAWLDPSAAGTQAGGAGGARGEGRGTPGEAALRSSAFRRRGAPQATRVGAMAGREDELVTRH